MAQRVTRVLLTVLLALALVMPPAAVACGPDFTPPTFIESRYPDVSPEEYAAGHLGVVLPTYAQSELVVAYRYFSGKPLSASEQKQVVAIRNHYQSNEAGGVGESDDAGESYWFSALDDVKNARMTNESVVIYGSAGPSWPYEQYANCLGDAFRTAATTLKARAQEFGEQSSAVASWINAQDIVFSNCNAQAPGEQEQVPPAADPSLPLVIRQDRDYQIAAAYFYAGRWDEAEKRFVHISADSASPWRAISGLVAARCEIREATLGTDDPVVRQESYDAADARLKRIIADPEFSSVKAGAERLQGYVEFRSQPGARLIELGQSLERAASPDTFGQDVDDYAKLLRPGRWNIQEVQPELVKSPMTDWMLSFGSADRRSDAEAHRIARWHETGSKAWLIAALTYADKDTPQLSELLDAAAFVPANSSAYLTVAFHRNRLLVAQGGDSDARADLDKILRMLPSGASLSTRNLFLAERMRAARNLDEFLEFALRQEIGDQLESAGTDAGVTVNAPPLPENGESGGASPEFDADAAATLTQAVPTQMLLQAAASPRLPKALRLQITQAAWVRAILLNQDQLAREIAPALSRLASGNDTQTAPTTTFFRPFQSAPAAPTAEPSATDSATLLKAYLEAPTPAARQFAAVFLILHEPGLRPSIYAGLGRESLSSAPTGELDNFRDNWWCSFAPPPSPTAGQQYYSRYNSGFYSIYTNLGGPLAILYPTGNPDPPHFLSADERKTAEAEWKSIMQLGSAPDWLAEQTIEWAKAHPADPRVPEALSLVVRSTHFGCSDSDTGKYSKEAFTLLHQRYPKSEWTADTPYWYN
jgi:hypothetical protein